MEEPLLVHSDPQLRTNEAASGFGLTLMDVEIGEARRLLRTERRLALGLHTTDLRF